MSLKGFTKPEEKEFLAGVNLTTVLHEYAVNYGYNKLIERLISANSSIRGGISFNNAKSGLSHAVKTFTR